MISSMKSKKKIVVLDCIYKLPFIGNNNIFLFYKDIILLIN